MVFISKRTWKGLNELSEKELRQLAELLGVGLSMMDSQDIDKEELVLILSTQPESEVRAALQRIERGRPSRRRPGSKFAT